MGPGMQARLEWIPGNVPLPLLAAGPGASHAQVEPGWMGASVFSRGALGSACFWGTGTLGHGDRKQG